MTRGVTGRSTSGSKPPVTKTPRVNLERLTTILDTVCRQDASFTAIGRNLGESLLAQAWLRQQGSDFRVELVRGFYMEPVTFWNVYELPSYIVDCLLDFQWETNDPVPPLQALAQAIDEPV